VETIFTRYLDCLREELATAAEFRVLPGCGNFWISTVCIRTFCSDWHGQSGKSARVKLEYAGLFEYFRCGGYGSDAQERAEVLRTGVRRAEALLGASIPPERVVIIGDRP